MNNEKANKTIAELQEEIRKLKILNKMYQEDIDALLGEINELSALKRRTIKQISKTSGNKFDNKSKAKKRKNLKKNKDT